MSALGSVASGERAEEEKAAGKSTAAAGIECRPNDLKASWERRLVHVAQGDEREHQQHARVGVAGSPKVLPEPVVGVPWISYEQRENTGPAVTTAGIRIKSTPATNRER